MDAWQFREGSATVTRLSPTCSASDIHEVALIQRDFVKFHYDLEPPTNMENWVKKLYLFAWEKNLAAGDIRAKLREPRRTFLVARGRTGIVGYLTFKTVPGKGDSGPHAFVCHTAVKESCREGGVGFLD